MIYAAITAALAAGDRLRHAFGSELRVTEEFAHDIKIAADKECQDLIYSILLKHHPDSACIGEEGDIGKPGAPIEWIVDPIDGTMNLAHSIPHFCVSIAAREAVSKNLLLGVIYDPMRNEMFTAARGSGAWLNGAPIRVSKREKLGDAILAVGFAKTQ